MAVYCSDSALCLSINTVRIMRSVCSLFALSLLSGCGLHIDYFQTETPAHRPAPIETRDTDKHLSQSGSHTVQRGDTLYAIARRYQRSVASIAAWNHLQSPYTLHPGQTLRVTPAAPPPSLVNSTPAVDQTPTRRVAPNYQGHTQQSTRSAQTSCATSQGQWQWPSRGQTETTFTRTGRRGLNIFGQLNQPVLAAASGQVIYSGQGVNGYESSLIIIQHSPTWLSVYSHTRNRRVSSGQSVNSGQPIADMGLDLQRRAVLHFELSCHEKTVNPLQYLPPS